MKVLGIETSCDETAVAVVEGNSILAERISSQIDLHSEYGGVVPELASREHLKKLNILLQECLSEAELGFGDIDAVAVTAFPGLEGSLLVGLTAGRTLSFLMRIPIVEVDHVEAHMFAGRFGDMDPPPGIGLIVSGGHTRLVLIKQWGDYLTLGDTRDDAAGEAFDKAASVLGLPYPGGPAIEKEAAGTDPGVFKFPVSRLGDSFDFSYSGLKTSVLYKVRYDLNEKVSEAQRRQIAAAFQEAAVTPLVKNAVRAAEKYSARWILVCGGVASNGRLREKLRDETEGKPFKAVFPPRRLCTDNASMVASCGEFYLNNT